ncbi:Polypeptide release factor (eRF1) in translation termination [Saccharomyces pastorianus]|uniref:Polypeptide release factor (ERF1) in translation termination n=1 Tax=Saccharomyces pastorianus TaxID=27292 RepID=A0A6C1EBI5_SACPS|nr:Polypeptide release factor (eRF1) in translation termination [Saccharomyces pastorianus]
MLRDEYGSASCIENTAHRFSVLSAISSAQQKLGIIDTIPENGLILFCGEIVTENSREKRVAIGIEPYKPISTTLYICDNKFHTEVLSELLQDDKFGFIVIGDQGALFGSVSGNTRNVLHKFTYDLPKKRSAGGQSALRFAHLREEEKHNYVRKVAEAAVQNFITDDRVNVKGLILAGSTDFKTNIAKSELFDPRLASKVISIVDVSYGGEHGFDQAIELSAEALANVKYVKEKKLLEAYFDEMSQDTGKTCYGIDDTLRALYLGAVEKLIVFENLKTVRYTFNDAEGNEVVKFVEPETKGKPHAIDKATGQEMDAVSEEPFIEWLAANHTIHGVILEFVTERSSEGSRFVTEFGGIGAMLLNKVNFYT